MSDQSTELRETVRRRYAAAAVQVTEGATACCGPEPVEVDENFGSTLYAADERDALPAEALAASLGCGNPTAVAELQEGERVLDLGSGGGIDVLLSARRVGPTGKAYGLDMTDEMLALALANAAKAKAHQRRVPQGHHRGDPAAREHHRRRDLQLRDQPVHRQARRLRRDLPRPQARRPHRRLRRRRRRRPDPRRSAPSAATTSAASRAPCPSPSTAQGLEAAGFTDIEITPTQPVADGMHSAIVRALKPVSAASAQTPTKAEAETAGTAGTARDRRRMLRRHLVLHADRAVHRPDPHRDRGQVDIWLRMPKLNTDG